MPWNTPKPAKRSGTSAWRGGHAPVRVPLDEPQGGALVSKEVELATNGGWGGVDVTLEFAKKVRAAMVDHGKLLLPIAHFTDYKRLWRELQLDWNVKIVDTREIRFWPPSYNREVFLKHLMELRELGVVEVVCREGQWFCELEIVECSKR